MRESFLTRHFTPYLAYYSYETCGGDSTAWATSLIESQVKGKELVVGVPKSFYPEQFMVDSNGAALPDGLYIEGTPMSGVWVDYLNEMATLGEFKIRYIPVSNASTSDHVSLWTACTQDVADGVKDMCVGNFWITPQRIGLGVDFITPATSDSFKLLTKLEKDKVSLYERLWTPFAPFSTGLWASIVVTWFLVAFLYSLLGTNHDFLIDDVDEDEEREKQVLNEFKWIRFERLRKVRTSDAYFSSKVSTCNAAIVFNAVKTTS